MLGDVPLLAAFNLQTFCQSDWDNPLLSKALVAMVEACDKHDFKPVVDSLKSICEKKQNLNEKKGSDQSCTSMNYEQSIGSPSDLTSSRFGQSNVRYSSKLDCYRTMLYLARY